MDPLTTLATVVSIGKSSVETVQALREQLEKSKVSKGELGQIREDVQRLESGLLQSQETIFRLQAAVLKLREENLRLGQEKLELREENRKLCEEKLKLSKENRKLAQESSSEQERAPKRQRHERIRVGQSWVVVEDGTKDPYFCATCYGRNGDLIPIQPLSGVFQSFGTHTCSTCSTRFNLRSHG